MDQLGSLGLSNLSTGEPGSALPLASLASLAHHGLLRAYLRQCLMAQAITGVELSDEERHQALMAFAQERRLANTEAIERFRIANLLTPEALALQVELPIRLRRHHQPQRPATQTAQRPEPGPASRHEPHRQHQTAQGHLPAAAAEQHARQERIAAQTMSS